MCTRRSACRYQLGASCWVASILTFHPKQRTTTASSSTTVIVQSARRAGAAHRRDARDRRRRHRGARAEQGRHRLADRDARAKFDAYGWLRRTIEPLAEGSNGRVSRAYRSPSSSTTRCSLHPEGKPIALPAQRHGHRLCLRGAHRHRQPRDRLQDQRQDRAAGLDLQNGDEVEKFFAAIERASGAADGLGVDRCHR